MVSIINNLEIHEDHMLVSVNPKVYPLEVVYQAAAPFIRGCFISIRGDPEEEIIVEFRLKQERSLELAGRFFNNMLTRKLLAYMRTEKGEYFLQNIIKAAIKKPAHQLESGLNDPYRELDITDEPSYLDDPYGIARPWEETHGNSQD